MRLANAILALACAVAPLAAADTPAVPRPAPDAAVKAWIASTMTGQLGPAAELIQIDLERMLVVGRAGRGFPPPTAPEQPAPGATQPGTAPPAGVDGAAARVMRNRSGSRLAGIDAAAAQEVAGQLAEVLRQIGVIAGSPATDQVPPPTGGWQTMMSRMATQGLLGAVSRTILAEGLETRQIAALNGFWAAHAAWAKTAPLDDSTVRAAAAARIVTLGAALTAAPPDEKEAVRNARVLGGIGGALHAFGLDGDAAFASATVTVESVKDDLAVVVVSFTAYGVPHALPLRLGWKKDAWTIVADSPLLRWEAGMGGMGGPGGRQGGRPRGGGGPGGQDQAPPTPDQTKPPERSF